MPRWTFAAGPWQTDPSRQLTKARSRKISYRRREGAKAAFEVNGRHPEALTLVELETDVHAWRDGVKMFRGRVGPTADEIETSHTTTITVGDYREVLARRLLREGDAVLAGPVNGDVGDVALDLVDLVQARPGGNLGIVAGVGIPAGRPMAETTFSPGQSIPEAIDLFANTDPATTGFEWQISPDLALDVYPGRRSRDLEVVLDYGGIVDKVSRSVDPGGFANDLRVSGGEGIPAVDRTVPAIADDPRGRWEAQVAHPDALTVDGLDGLADADLVDRQTFRPAYSARLKRNRWEGPDALWLGDTVTLSLRSGRLLVLEDLEVEALDVEITDDGDEVVTLALGSLFVDYVERIRASEARLRLLERLV